MQFHLTPIQKRSSGVSTLMVAVRPCVQARYSGYQAIMEVNPLTTGVTLSQEMETLLRMHPIRISLPIKVDFYTTICNRQLQQTIQDMRILQDRSVNFTMARSTGSITAYLFIMKTGQRDRHPT